MNDKFLVRTADAELTQCERNTRNSDGCSRLGQWIFKESTHDSVASHQPDSKFLQRRFDLHARIVQAVF